MADNAPFSANRPPYPNVHVNLPGRLEVLVCKLTVTSGTPAITQSASSAGFTVANGAAGIYDLAFPAAPAGTIGWTQISAPEQGTPAAVVFALDSDTNNYVTGVLALRAFDAATPSAVDLEGSVIITIYRLTPAT